MPIVIKAFHNKGCQGLACVYEAVYFGLSVLRVRENVFLFFAERGALRERMTVVLRYPSFLAKESHGVLF